MKKTVIEHMMQDYEGALQTVEALRPSLMKEWGRLLRQYRKENAVSLRTLGQSLGFSAAYLSDIELGRRMAPKSVQKLIL